jgi:hypothetical protein
VRTGKHLTTDERSQLSLNLNVASELPVRSR